MIKKRLSFGRVMSSIAVLVFIGGYGTMVQARPAWDERPKGEAEIDSLMQVLESSRNDTVLKYTMETILSSPWSQWRTHVIRYIIEDSQAGLSPRFMTLVTYMMLTGKREYEIGDQASGLVFLLINNVDNLDTAVYGREGSLVAGNCISLLNLLFDSDEFGLFDASNYEDGESMKAALLDWWEANRSRIVWKPREGLKIEQGGREHH